MPTLLDPTAPLDLFGQPLRLPTRRERQRVATVSRPAAARTAAGTTARAGSQAALPWVVPPKPTPPDPAPIAPEPASTAPLALPAQVWKASELGSTPHRCRPSGHPLLDAELPGGGWPTRSLTELLLTQPGCVEWRLLAPGLAPLCAPASPGGKRRQLLLINPPHAPHPRGLAAWGLQPADCIWVRPQDTRQRLWATEQVLKADADELAALLTWLPELRPEQLRRLQTLAARCRAPCFLLRPASSVHAQASSAAPLRLRVSPGPHWAQLQVELLKRRGPPLDSPLWLHAPPPTLAAVLPPPERNTLLAQGHAPLPATLQALVGA